ncbi:diguanylate cyclase [Thioalkalivibrio sp. ALE23]|uniref:diguanylate cyclase n=1 Tax=Thioalkalivibrio sp. ALE23 TaxID=1265495 RepID=UPI001E638987|nr:diguanylate cyclase [Thioalkalivibrio sp. ALE23]
MNDTEGQPVLPATFAGSSSVPVGEIAQRDLVRCAPDESVAEAARRMHRARCSSVVVVGEDDRPQGIWTERDALRLDPARMEERDRPMASVMTSPVRSIPGSVSATEAHGIMTEAGIRHLLVIDDDGRPFGIISQTDLALSHGAEAYLRLREVGTALGGRPLRLEAEQPLSDATRAMSRAGVAAAVVSWVDGGPPGILTERDVVRQLTRAAADPSVAEVASRPLLTVDTEESLFRARQMMLEHGIRRLGITDPESGEVLGLVGFAELLASTQSRLLEELGEALRQARDELRLARRQERRFEEVRKRAPVGLLILDSTGVIQDANPMVGRLLGRDPLALIGCPLADYLPGQPALYRALDELQAGNDEELRLELRLEHPTRKDREQWVEVAASVFREAGDTPHMVSMVLADISDRAERRALEAEQRLLATAFHTTHALLICDPDGRIERVNPAFTETTGYAPEEVIGATPAILSSGRHDAEFYREMWTRLQAEGRWQGEVWNRRRNGEVYPQWESITAVYNDAGELEHYVAVFHEITEQKRLEAELERFATHDRLTEIYNRAKLHALLEQAHAERERYETAFSLIMFDVDHFKSVNDTWGHLAGDSVLRELADRVRTVLRSTDHFARWGGEEFLVLATHTDAEGAWTLAERIRRVVEDKPFETVGGVTVSLGVAGAERGESLRRLEERADQALYRAKRGGRNRGCTA